MIDRERAAAVVDGLEKRLVESRDRVADRSPGGAGRALDRRRRRAGRPGERPREPRRRVRSRELRGQGEYGGEFDPHEFLRTFNTGAQGQDDLEQSVFEENGRTVREFTMPVSDVSIEAAPGIEFPA